MPIYNKYKNLLANGLIFILAITMLIDHHMTKSIAFILLIVWLLNRNFKDSIYILKDKIAQSFFIIFLLFIIGLLWSEDIGNGLKILERESLLLISPLLILLLDRKYLKYIMPTILLVVFISEFIFLLEHFDIADLYYKSKTIYHYPFMHRMYFSTLVAFSIGYTVLKIDFKNYRDKYNFLYFLFIIISIYTLLAMGARSGYINLFLIILIIFIYKMNSINIKNFLFMLISISMLFSVFYSVSPTFNSKVNLTIKRISNLDIKNQAENMDKSKRNSFTCRLEFWYHSSKIIKENPIFGVGTGDSVVEVKRLLSQVEYDKLRQQCGLNVKKHFNTHNLYVNILLLFGTIGLLVLLYSFYLQISVAVTYKSASMFILIIPTMISMLSQSALFTSHYFISFYAFILTILYLEAKNQLLTEKSSLS